MKSVFYQERGGREENGEGGKMAAGTGGVCLVASDNLTPSLTPPHHPAPRIWEVLYVGRETKCVCVCVRVFVC